MNTLFAVDPQSVDPAPVNGRPRPLRTAATIAALVAGLSLVGCGGSQDTNGSASEKPATPKIKKLTKENFVDEIFAAETKAGSVHVHTKYKLPDGRKRKIDADVNLGDDGKTTGASVISTGALPNSTVLADGFYYFRFNKNDKYFKMDPDRDAKKSTFLNANASVIGVDPIGPIKGLEGAIASVEKEGTSVEMDGVQTQAYRVVIDSAKFFDDPESQKTKVTYTLNVGPDNLPRQVTSDFSGKDRTKTTAEFSQWGKAPTVSAPSSAEVTDKDPLGGAGY